MDRPARLDILQVYRGLAAMLVVMYHATVYSAQVLGYTFLGGVFLFGFTGVDFFFVLSGFIIYYIHSRDLGQSGRLRPYARKRLARIYPVYWVVTGIKLALIAAVPSIAKSYEREPGVIVSSFLLLPQTNLPVIGAAWTLTYEMLFYILFGVAILLGRRWALRLAALWVAATVAVTAAGYLGFWRPSNPLLFTLFNERNLEFCLGCLSAALVMSGRVPWPRVLGAAGAALFALAAWNLVSGGFPLPFSASFGLASFLLVTGSAAYELQRRPALPRPLVFLGDASYSLYLTHVMFINAAVVVVRQFNLNALVNPLPLTFAIIVFAVLAACAFYLVVERPLLKAFSGGRARAKSQAVVTDAQPVP